MHLTASTLTQFSTFGFLGAAPLPNPFGSHDVLAKTTPGNISTRLDDDSSSELRKLRFIHKAFNAVMS